jgi:hypothetical protein
MYWFYTDLEAPNKMDAKPFFEFSMLDVRNLVQTDQGFWFKPISDSG